MTWTPQPVPATIQRDAQAYLAAEFRKLKNTLDVVEFQTFVERGAEPSRLVDGMVAYADGTNWNPGDGEGLYARVGGAWQTLVGLQPDEAETISGDWTFSGPGPTFTDGNAFTLDPTSGAGDIRFEDGGALKALIRWTQATNVLGFQDRDPSAQTRMEFNFDSGDLAVYGDISGVDISASGVISSTSYIAHRPDGGSVSPNIGLTYTTPDHSIGTISGNVGDVLATTLFINDGTVNARCGLFIDGTQQTWGLAETYSSGGNYNFVIKQGGGSALNWDFANARCYFYDDVTIDSDDSGPMLQLGDGAGADGDILIEFNMDRGFRFMQYSTGANTGLNLRSQTDGKYFRVTSTAADLVISRHYGNTAGTSYFDVGGTEDTYSVSQRWWANSTSSTYYGLAHCRTNSQSPTHLTTIGNAGGPFLNYQAAAISDDSTATFSIDTYSMVWITNSYNGTTYAHLGFAGTQAPVNYGSGSNVVTGATNPDTDGKVNIWPSATGVMSIKNRMGVALSFYVISMDRN